MMDWKTCGVNGGADTFPSICSFLRAIKALFVRSVILWPSFVLNYNWEPEFERWGVWQVWDFEEVWSLPTISNTWKSQMANNASSLLARQPSSLCQHIAFARPTVFTTVVIINIIIHLPFSLLCKKTSFWKSQRWNKLQTSRKQNVYQQTDTSGEIRFVLRYDVSVLL